MAAEGETTVAVPEGSAGFGCGEQLVITHIDAGGRCEAAGVQMGWVVTAFQDERFAPSFTWTQLKRLAMTTPKPWNFAFGPHASRAVAQGASGGGQAAAGQRAAAPASDAAAPCSRVASDAAAELGTVLEGFAPGSPLAKRLGGVYRACGEHAGLPRFQGAEAHNGGAHMYRYRRVGVADRWRVSKEFAPEKKQGGVVQVDPLPGGAVPTHGRTGVHWSIWSHCLDLSKKDGKHYWVPDQPLVLTALRTEAEVELALVAAHQGVEALAQLTAALRQGDVPSLSSAMDGLARKLLEKPADAKRSWGVTELREQALTVVTLQSALWAQQLAMTQVAQASLAQVRQETTMAGLAQGLGFLRTRRVDLSGECFGDVGPEQALAIATACGPELDALFLPVPLVLPPEVVTQLTESCPQARCLALGGEVTEVGFEEILRQYKEIDAVMADALGAASIAEGVPPCAPTVNTRLHVEDDAPQAAAAAERRITPSAQAAGGATDCCTLDLTDAAQFRHLTDAGLAEIEALCPNLSALFLPPDSKVTDARLAALRQRCPGVRVSVLGRQLSREQLLYLLRSYAQTRWLDLSSGPVPTGQDMDMDMPRLVFNPFDAVRGAGLAELLDLCPSTEAVFKMEAVFTTVTEPEPQLVVMKQIRGSPKPEIVHVHSSKATQQDIQVVKNAEQLCGYSVIEDGLIVSDTDTNSIAFKNGLRSGYQITHVDGEKVSTWSDYTDALALAAGKSSFCVTVSVANSVSFDRFETVGAPHAAITSGKVYYELEVRCVGRGTQFGWASTAFDISIHDYCGIGVGDDATSWGVDGSRRKKWHSGSTNWGDTWADGDTVGCAADLEAGQLRFSRNGSWAAPNGLAFEGVQPTGGLYPALSASKATVVVCNLGENPWKFAPPDESYVSVSEALAGCQPSPRVKYGPDLAELQAVYPATLQAAYPATHFVTVSAHAVSFAAKSAALDAKAELDRQQGALRQSVKSAAKPPAVGPSALTARDEARQEFVAGAAALSRAMAKDGPLAGWQAGPIYADAWRRAQSTERQLALFAAQCQQLAAQSEPGRSTTALQELQERNESLRREVKMAHLDCDRLRLAESEAASPSPRFGVDSTSLPSVSVTPEQHDARAALLARPIQDWTEEQVQEWIGVIGLPADSAEVVQSALAADETDGEDLKDMAIVYQESGSAKRLQKLLKKAGGGEPASLAKQTMALHATVHDAAPSEDKSVMAQTALDTARAELRRNAVALRAQVVHLVSLASQHFPELLGHEDVHQFMGSDGLHASDHRQLNDYDDMRPLTSGRNELLLAKYAGVDVCLKRFPVQGDMRAYTREVLRVQRLRHPFIIHFTAAFEDGGSMYLEMEYFANGSLRHWIDTTQPDAAHKRSLLRQVLLALACMHSQGIVHCDIKAENVLVADDGTPRICDFEMSKDLDAALSSTMAGFTRGFVAPEILSGHAKPSPASDMFAFGILVLNAVCEPGLGETYPLTNVSKVTDPSLKDLLPRLLSRDPTSRPSATQLQAEPYFASDAVDEWGRVDVGQRTSTKSCRQEMLDADSAALGVPKPDIVNVVARIDSRITALGQAMEDAEKNHRFTLFLYTIHSKIYPKFNDALRERPPGAHFDAWSPFLWHMMAALRSLPDISRTVYRGIRNPPNLANYTASSKIHWSGFSSTTINPSVARDGFAGPGGVVFVLHVHNAKDIQPFSWFGIGESELLLNPNMEFLVTKELHTPADGPLRRRHVIEMQQIPDDTLWS